MTSGQSIWDRISQYKVRLLDGVGWRWWVTGAAACLRACFLLASSSVCSSSSSSSSSFRAWLFLKSLTHSGALSLFHHSPPPSASWICVLQTPVVEPKSKSEFVAAMEVFYERLKQPAAGSVFFAVCRGKVCPHARTHARTHAHTHTHAHTYKHTHTH